MTETPEQRVARLQAELARAKVDALQKELAEAQANSGMPTAGADNDSGGAYPSRPFVYQGSEGLRQLQAMVETMDGGIDRGPVQHTPVTTRLAAAPRAVPFAYRAVALNFSWWSLFALLMLMVAPIALYLAVPAAALVVAAVGVVGVLCWKLSKAFRQWALLRWGDIAEVVHTEVLSRGTYYSGTTVQNVRMSQASGWKVTRKMYSGPITKTRIDYRLNGTPGSMVLKGLSYAGGVILADTRNPARALCVSSFPYDLEPDPSGNWPGRLATATRIGALIMPLAVAGWAVGMVLIYLAVR